MIDDVLTSYPWHAGEGTQAFCSGGDQSVRGEGGYVGPDKIPRLNVLDLQACSSLVSQIMRS